MLKKEWVYREILYQLLKNKRKFFSQKSLANVCKTSIGNVNQAIKPFERMNAIEKKNLGFRIIDAKKILFYWASIRNLEKDILYKTFINKRVEVIEKELPPCLFTAYSGYKSLFKIIPSDYSEVFAYVDEKNLKIVEERFPQKMGKANLIILKMDEHLKKFDKITLAQLFVDLWNINTWYAKEFLNKLEVKINGILERPSY
ncbi:MAG: hypothetical protein J7J92_02990 [Candidatus Aenigmarchaeota archaeon]|nr:hypothetical protein [Candidatus Aenigmarchaeota archaeon]